MKIVVKIIFCGLLNIVYTNKYKLFVLFMKYKRIIDDKSKRLLFKKSELKKCVIFLLNKKYSHFPFFWWKEIEVKISSKIEIKRYCILSGRSRGVFQDFKLSRILLRKMGAKGYLSGLKKKSW